jgi:hypothetical protein
MSGITKSNAGIHVTRQPSGQEKQLLDDVLCLYQPNQATKHIRTMQRTPFPRLSEHSSSPRQHQEPVQRHAEAFRREHYRKYICQGRQFQYQYSMVLTNRALAQHTRLIDTTGNATQPHAKIRLQAPYPIQGRRLSNSKLSFYVQQLGTDLGAS